MSIFHLPDLGEGLAEATIVAWHVRPGDVVAAEQALLSVETAKAVVDIPSPQAGRIKVLLAQAGDIVPTHAALVEFIDEPGTVASTPRTDNGSVVGVLPADSGVRHEGFIIGRHWHTEARLQKPAARRVTPRDDSPTPLFPGGEALDPTRRTMADNVSRAHREVVAVTLTAEVEVVFEDRRLLTARLVRALVAGARAEPALNAWYDGAAQKRLVHAPVHVGIAVDTPHGLLVPVLRDAQALDAGAVARHVAELKQAAHERTLAPSAFSGATLTLSNFGSLAGRFATPLVLPPQVAILGAGHAWDGVRPANGAARPARLLPLSLTFDHRAVTGGEAARFLAAVCADLEQA